MVPAPETSTIVLPDGAAVTLRPIAADDKGLLTDAFDHLGTESRYRRFLGPHDALSTSELRYFTEVDHVGHEAVVAIDPVSGHGIGVARYVALADVPAGAEMAVAVIDDWQGRGLGTALLHALVGRARANGIRTFRATVLSTNRAMLALLHELGDVHQIGRDGPTSEFSIDLPEEGVGPLAALLRHAAEGTATNP